MFIPSQSKHLSTYILTTNSSEEEIRHLQLQDHLLILGLGGVLPEQHDLSSLRHVLDIGCNSGNWLMETARTYPHISELIGLNISRPMVKYTNEQARNRQLNERVTFRAFNSLGMLEFPNDKFDLINIQFGQSFLRTWDWPRLLQEFRRITRPGGIVRITEMNFFQSPSALLERQKELVEQTLYQAGHRLAPCREDIVKELLPLLRRNGLQHIQVKRHNPEYHAGTAEGSLLAEKIVYSYRTLRPFLQKWTRLPLHYDEDCQQLEQEVQHPDFRASWPLVTIWGTVAPKQII